MNAGATIPAPGAHGGDAARIARARGADPASLVDLSASMNPFAPDVAATLTAVLAEDPMAVGAYPDPGEATDALAAAAGVDADRLVLTNGGAEAIALVAGVVRSAHVVEPEFSLYRRHLERTDAGPRWRSNPSSPLGRLAADDEVAAVWDEAFYPLATGRWTRGDDTSWRLGSLTKLWACPGLRLGFFVAPDGAAAAAARHRQPRWAVNGLALAALPRLLAATDLVGWHASLVAARSRFAAALRGLGLAVTETDANWVLVDRPGLRDALIPYGVVVRDCASFGLHGWARVAVPTEALTDRVLVAFERIGAAT